MTAGSFFAAPKGSKVEGNELFAPIKILTS
jgi:hypothetical protein